MCIHPPWQLPSVYSFGRMPRRMCFFLICSSAWASAICLFIHHPPPSLLGVMSRSQKKIWQALTMFICRGSRHLSIHLPWQALTLFTRLCSRHLLIIYLGRRPVLELGDDRNRAQRHQRKQLRHAMPRLHRSTRALGLCCAYVYACLSTCVCVCVLFLKEPPPLSAKTMYAL